MIGQGIVPAALEMIDALSIQAVQNVSDAGYPDDAGAVLLIELEGLVEEVDEIGPGGGVRPLGHWRQRGPGRRGGGGEGTSFGRAAKARWAPWAAWPPNYYLVDGVVPRTQLAAVLRQVAAIGRKHGISIANVFHAGDGNLHPCLLFDERQPGALETITVAGAEVLEVCVAAGGALTGEHGVGLEKKEQMPLVYSRGRHGGHAPGPRRLRSRQPDQSRQDIPRRHPARRLRPSPHAGNARLTTHPALQGPGASLTTPIVDQLARIVGRPSVFSRCKPRELRHRRRGPSCCGICE